MDPLDILRSSGRRLAIVVSRDMGVPLVYVLHRVPSPAFLRLAIGSLGAAAAAAQVEAEKEARLLGVKDPKVIEQVEAEMGKEAERRAAAEIKRTFTSPDELESALGRIDELVCASVVAIGLGRAGLKFEEGLQPHGVTPEDLCRNLNEDDPEAGPVYLRQVRWGPDPDRGEHQIDRLSEAERLALVGAIREAFGPKAEHFRGPRAARRSGSVGDEVRPAPERAAPVRRPHRGSARSRGDEGR